MHLTYCMNIHPGETPEAQVEAIATHATAVKRAVRPDGPFGLGLRIGADAARLWREPARREALRALLTREGLYVFTMNGFPYGAFHGTRVKEAVYAPDWRSEERLLYTLDLADLLAALLPEGTEGSISTVPGSFGAWITSQTDRDLLAARLAEAASALADLEARTGRYLHLGLEPEPACLMETTQDALTFFRETLWGPGAVWLSALRGCGRQEAEALLRRHVGLCFDTCHAAVAGEHPAEALALLRAEGLLISKIQLSAALAAPAGDAGRTALAPFAEPVYFHQTRAFDARGRRLAAWNDLPDALRTPVDPTQMEWRVHFHVPLFWRGQGVLRSTAEGLDEAFWRQVREGATGHLEVETYTFGVLPDDVRPAAVEDSLAEELRWVLQYV